MANLAPLIIENAQLVLRNFAGRESKYNPPGQRNFGVIISPEMADGLTAQGWNIRSLNSRDPDSPPTPFIPVAVSFQPYPPRIHYVTSKQHTVLGEEEVSLLDVTDIVRCDVVINPSRWNVRGQTGIKAYLRELYVQPVEYDFLQNYNIPM